MTEIHTSKFEMMY